MTRARKRSGGCWRRRLEQSTEGKPVRNFIFPQTHPAIDRHAVNHRYKTCNPFALKLRAIILASPRSKGGGFAV